ncbi:MAG: NADH:ubiquinone reductase (Na(+)-transporting) subunit C [Rikenellaceae bacterium]|nr:NADH:ubiquinone reductase (Na(+)-transporting) subunit C [Rikenellaceae bacterium]
MNKNSNTYIILYATVMVVLVALVLSLAAINLQPLQTANQENEMKGAILLSIGQGGEMTSVKDKTAYINEQYDRYIVDTYAVRPDGEKVDGADAFALLANLKKELDKPAGERLLPVFVSRSDEGTERYVLPLYGAGLWGPIWGYLALEDDWTTVYGAVFDHKSETPGLGAEIATPPFQNMFKGKSIFDGDRLVGITVLKGAGASASNPNAVDAISGGTITSRGVENMIKDNLSDYAEYIVRQATGHDARPGETDLETEEGAIHLTGESTPDIVGEDEPLTIDQDEQ